jgi:hypothetical protein
MVGNHDSHLIAKASSFFREIGERKLESGVGCLIFRLSVLHFLIRDHYVRLPPTLWLKAGGPLNLK